MPIYAYLEDNTIPLAPVDPRNATIIEVVAIFKAWPDTTGDTETQPDKRLSPLRVEGDGYIRCRGHDTFFVGVEASFVGVEKG